MRVPAQANGIRAEGKQSPERSDAGTSIVEQAFVFVKNNLSGAQQGELKITEEMAEGGAAGAGDGPDAGAGDGERAGAIRSVAERGARRPGGGGGAGVLGRGGDAAR
jgi:hypothetical protein